MKIIDVILCLIILLLSVISLGGLMRLNNLEKELDYITKSVTYTNDRQKEIENDLAKTKRVLSQDLQIINQGFENEQ